MVRLVVRDGKGWIALKYLYYIDIDIDIDI